METTSLDNSKTTKNQDGESTTGKARKPMFIRENSRKDGGMEEGLSGGRMEADMKAILREDLRLALGFSTEKEL